MTTHCRRARRAERACFRPVRGSRAGRRPSPVAAFLLLMVSSQPLAAASPEEPIDIFQQQIVPLLQRHCLECHTASNPSGGLDLSSKAGFQRGAESGPITAPAHEESKLWLVIEEGSMPPEGPGLTDIEQQSWREWLASGGAWSLETLDSFANTTDRRAGRDWWSLQPLVDAPTPDLADDLFSRNPIDRFILAQLRTHRLVPAEEAPPVVLLRRVHFDLTGLPPDRETYERFAKDVRPDALERQVDRLLASPAHGERWARHWLDIVRFGESQGYERNRIREQAWRYRDWVIAAFNQGLPYDEFVRLQIAGDAIAPHDYGAVVATGYHVSGTWDQVAHLEGSSAMRAVARQDHLEDLVATWGQTFVALSLQCARCHDHKVDPVTQQDYYSLVASLSGIEQQEKEREGLQLQGLDRVALSAFESSAFEGVLHVPHARKLEPVPVLMRGRLDSPGPLAEPGEFRWVKLSTISARPLATQDSDASRRLALANWLVAPDHPLTARVMVNRLWHYHFGLGLIDTPSDFGFSGGRPSHPELLDHLASRLITEGWDLKRLHRKLVTTAVYRQSSLRISTEAEALDTENRWHWRAPLRRLEGEALRDAILETAGVLDRRMGGPSFRDVHVKLSNNHEFTDPTDEFSTKTLRRSIYRLWARSGNHPLLQAFDCPDPTVSAARRAMTITPVQALSLENDAFVEQCAEHFARGLERDHLHDLDAQIVSAWSRALGREPRDSELTQARNLAKKHGLRSVAAALFNTNEFLFLD